MTKRRIQPKMGYFLIWKEFVFVDFRQWIRQHVQFSKKRFTLSSLNSCDHELKTNFGMTFFWFYWKECQKVILKWFPFIDKPGRKSLWKGTYDHLRNFDFIGPGVVSCLVKKKKKKNARNSPKLARQIAMPSCRPPLLASWIKKEFLCGSFYAQVMLESVWTKEDEFLCFTRLKLFECSTKKLTGLTILLLCTWRKRGENNSKMFQKIFA